MKTKFVAEVVVEIEGPRISKKFMREWINDTLADGLEKSSTSIDVKLLRACVRSIDKD